MAKGMTLTRSKKLLGIDDQKLDIYVKWYKGEVLTDPDPKRPHMKWLTPEQKVQLERFRRIFAMFTIGRTDELIRNVIQKEFQVEWRQAYNLLAEAYVVYGVTEVADKEGKKRASINFYRTLANLAFKERDYETAGKLWEKADKLEGLYEAEIEGLDPNDFKAQAKLVFINNMNVFNKKQKELDLDI